MSTAYRSFPLDFGFTPRKHDRSVLILPAILTWANQDHSTRIVNIGAGGALIECSVSMPLHSLVFLRCGSIATYAEVVWMKAGQAGVKFQSPLADRDLNELRFRSEAIAARRLLNRPGQAEVKM